MWLTLSRRKWVVLTYSLLLPLPRGISSQQCCFRLVWVWVCSCGEHIPAAWWGEGYFIRLPLLVCISCSALVAPSLYLCSCIEVTCGYKHLQGFFIGGSELKLSLDEAAMTLGVSDCCLGVSVILLGMVMEWERFTVNQHKEESNLTLALPPHATKWKWAFWCPQLCATVACVFLQRKCIWIVSRIWEQVNPSSSLKLKRPVKEIETLLKMHFNGCLFICLHPFHVK